MGFGILVVLAPRLPGFATGLIVLLSIEAALLLFPPSFQIDPRGPMTDYECRDFACAERFAALDGAVPGDEA